MMKATLFALFVSLLMVGCGNEAKKPLDSIPESNQSYVETQPTNPTTVAKIDMVEIETVNRIAAEPIDRHDILSVAAGGLTQGLKLQKRGKEGEELLYAPNQQTPFTGSAAWYHDNGKLSIVSQFKDGKMDGLWTRWYKSGQKREESNYKNDKLMSVEVWKPHGEKCPVTNVKDGNGVVVRYFDDGTELGRRTYKVGEVVED